MSRPELSPATERLIARLTAELEPVRPLPPLRWPAAALLGCWLSLAALLALWPGPQAVGNPGFVPTILAMSLLAVGGAWAALALCTPDRDASARTGFALCGLGMAAIVVLAFDEGFPPATFSYLRDTLWQDWICVGIATGLALPLWGIILAFGRRAWILRHTAMAVAAGIGSVAAGAMLVHALCDEGCARHALGSHALAPIWGTSLLILPALYTLRRREPS